MYNKSPLLKQETNSTSVYSSTLVYVYSDHDLNNCHIIIISFRNTFATAVVHPTITLLHQISREKEAQSCPAKSFFVPNATLCKTSTDALHPYSLCIYNIIILSFLFLKGHVPVMVLNCLNHCTKGLSWSLV